MRKAPKRGRLENFSDLLPSCTKKYPLAIFWYDDNVIFAVPLHVGLTLPILHGDPPWPLDRAFLRRIVFYSRRKRQSLCNSHRQSRWINSDFVKPTKNADFDIGREVRRFY